MIDLNDPSLFITPHPLFQCTEAIVSSKEFELDEEDEDEEIGRIKFSCTIPLTTKCTSSKSNSPKEDASNERTISTLQFRCREESVGFLNSKENAASATKDDSLQEVVDPNFFDQGYTLAGRTGFQIWAGSRVMMEALLPWWSGDETCEVVENVNACNKLKHYQDLMSKGAKVLELGSGVGVVGTSLAAIGASVLLTDLPTLVDYSLWPNLISNKSVKSCTEDNDLGEISKSPEWLGTDAIQIHNGWASSTPLDWSKPLKSQLSQDQTNNIEIIISCDCVWLVSMLDGLLDSVSSVFENSKNDVSFLMSFQRRDTKEGNESSTFTTVERVLSSVEERGWNLECLAWRRVIVSGDDDFKEEKDVFVFEIKP